jgi:hypothetical protein
MEDNKILIMLMNYRRRLKKLRKRWSDELEIK